MPHRTCDVPTRCQNPEPLGEKLTLLFSPPPLLHLHLSMGTRSQRNQMGGNSPVVCQTSYTKATKPYMVSSTELPSSLITGKVLPTLEQLRSSLPGKRANGIEETKRKMRQWTTPWQYDQKRAESKKPHPHPDAKVFICSNQSAAIQAQQEPNWSTVLKRGGKKKVNSNLKIVPKPTIQGSSIPAPSPHYPALPKILNQPLTVDDSNSWIIRFHGQPPPFTNRMSDREMFN